MIGILKKWDEEHRSPLPIPIKTTPIGASSVENKIAEDKRIEAPKGIESPIFVDVTSDYLRDLVKGKLTTERNRLILPYIGKQVRWEVIIDDVSTSIYGGSVWSDDDRKLLKFDKSWVDSLEILRKGQAIKITGKIEDITPVRVTLDDCKLEK